MDHNSSATPVVPKPFDAAAPLSACLVPPKTFSLLFLVSLDAPFFLTTPLDLPARGRGCVYVMEPLCCMNLLIVNKIMKVNKFTLNSAPLCFFKKNPLKTTSLL